MAGPGQHDTRLDEIIADYLEAVESGQAPDRQALLDRYPDLASELLEFFADQDQFDSLIAPLRHGSGSQGSTGSFRAGDAPTVELPPHVPGRTFGGYELLEEIARGGMGVVYKARQKSLNRVVALKMIRAGRFASSAEVQRFRLEAETAAHLDHPHIVPIYEVGEEEGLHYFSMKLIEGGDLGRHVKGLVDRPREAAALLVTVARAVDYAHQRGLLHRDLKPANILLQKIHQKDTKDAKDSRDEERTPPKGRPASGPFGPFGPLCLCGESFLPYITDFGLAKVPGPARGDAVSTQAGALVGTPAYMAPEQAGGQTRGLTTAADVYSLGVILYELLTGRVPFRGPTPLETVLLVLTAEPAAPRTLNRRVPRDLETICLKCLHKDPARRYPTAAALADDLERFRHGEPIVARRSGTAERFLRWCRRRPLVAGLAAALLLSVTAGFALVVWQWQRAEANLLLARQEQERAEGLLAAVAQKQAEAEEHARRADDNFQRAERLLLEANTQRARAEENFQQAHDVVNDFYLRASEELNQAQGPQPLGKELLARALKYYRDFLEQRAGDPTLRAELADACFRAAHITSAIGSKKEALELYQQARAHYAELEKAKPGDARLRRELRRTLTNMAVMQSALGRHDAARESAEAALALVESWATAQPGNAAALHDLAFVAHLLAHLDCDTGDKEKGLAGYRRSRLLWEQLVCVSPKEVRYQGDLALCINNIGVTLGQLSRLAEALQAFAEARDLREKLVADWPRSPEYKIALAASYRDLGLTHGRLGHPEEELRFALQALDLRRQLATANPSVTLYQSDLADSLVDVGNIHRDNRRRGEALDCYNQALVIQQKLTKLDAGVPGYQQALARTHFAVGGLLADNRQYKDALRAYRTARTIQDRLVQADPGKPEYHRDLGQTLTDLGEMLARPDAVAVSEGGADAVTNVRLGLARQREAARLAPQQPRFKRGAQKASATLLRVAGDLAGRRQDDPQGLVRIARELCLAAKEVAAGNEMPGEAERAEQAGYADLAWTTLKQALAAGYRDLEDLSKNPDLMPLRDRPEFKTILNDLRK
jgi:serine/threonine protein kinase/tetratricopeptide (TPR) repeat protein